MKSFIIENDLHVPDELIFKKLLENEFLGDNIDNEVQDFHEHYRWQEYQCFTNSTNYSKVPKNKGLNFSDIAIPKGFDVYFQKSSKLKI